MKTMDRKKLEILAPAGSFESLKAAIHAGADAVYMGGSLFGARAYADNPKGSLLLDAIDYAHLYGVKLYLTVNTLLKDRELTQQLYGYLQPCYEHGLDAVIVQDIGVMSAVQEWFPKLPVHASTQMTVCGSGGVKLLKEAGVQRVVLARELSLTEIEKIHRETGMEIECFVHGALCYCYSGQCLFSSILGGRSGNRGRCAQPCRLSYDVLADGKVISGKGENALLSPKDMCAVELLPQIAEAGVYSLKIEGRMKRPEYTAGVVRIYRKYADWYLEHGAKGYCVSEEDKKELFLLFNRDGFSRGYYEQHNGRNMMALNNRKLSDKEKKAYEALISSLKEQYVDTEKKIPVTGCLYAGAGQPMRLELASPSCRLTVYGGCPQLPRSAPMEPEQLKKQLCKTGNTPFVWKDLQIQTEGPLFVPVQELNSFRREALEQLRTAIAGSFFRTAEKGLQHKEAASPEGQPCRSFTQAAGLHISVETSEQLHAVLDSAERLKQRTEAPLRAVYVDAESLEEQLLEAVNQLHEKGLEAYVMLPAVFRAKTAERYRKYKDNWTSLPADGYVLKNLEEYEFLQEIRWNKAWIPDHNMYLFNQKSREFWRKKGSFMQTNPLELNSRELKEVSAGDSIQIIYGRYPMMITAGCLHKTLNQCRKKPGRRMLKDRYEKLFPVKNYCRDCYNVIFNSQPLWLLDQPEELEALRAGAYRIMFTTEKRQETLAVLDSWMKGGRPPADFTRGHFKRGVE